MWGAIAQPTIRRLQASSTTARYSQPDQVGTYVMSATHSWSGPLAEKFRFTRSGAGLALASLFVVPVLKRLRVTPSRSSIATTFLGMFILLAGVACDDPVTAPRGSAPTLVAFSEIAGSYEGTVQKPGASLTQAGIAELIVDQIDGNGIAGDMILEAQFSEGETISVRGTYTGEVGRGRTTHTVRLRLPNPVCGGTTEFTGTYASEHFTLSGQYVLKEADGCRTIATLDLTVSVDKSAE